MSSTHIKADLVGGAPEQHHDALRKRNVSPEKANKARAEKADWKQRLAVQIYNKEKGPTDHRIQQSFAVHTAECRVLGDNGYQLSYFKKNIHRWRTKYPDA